VMVRGASATVVSSEVGKEDTIAAGLESVSECKWRGKETRRNMKATTCAFTLEGNYVVA
jgi:hypothetical protein